MRLHLFGASVTAQSIHHKTGEAVGYAEHLKERLSSVYNELEVEVTAAGSSHFNDAGYCLLPEVIDSRPDILILDWHTTCLATFDDRLWKAAIGLIRESGIKTIITIFPKLSCFEAHKERPNVAQARDVVGGNIFLLNLSLCKDFNPAIHLRDEVHTTSAGGAFYAEALVSKICSILTKEEEVSSDLESPFFLSDEKESIPSVSKYAFGLDFVSCQNISFVVSPDSNLYKPSLVLHGKIGPFSPIVRLLKSGEYLSKISVWDPWCSWTRTNYTSVPLSGPYAISEEYQLEVADEVPAYFECRDQGFDFAPYKKRELLLKSIYCIGGVSSSVCHD